MYVFSSLRKPRNALLAAGLLLAGLGAGGHITSVLAGDSVVNGTSLCLRPNGPVMNADSRGSCNGNGSLVTVANLSGVTALADTVAALESKLPTTIGAINGGSIGSTQTYTVPDGVSELKVELWGGGGGSSECNACIGNNNQNGGGGAQGDYAHSVINVSSGETCVVTVGSGGQGGSFPSEGHHDGLNGEPSSITCGDTTVSAPGGAGGSCCTPGYGGQNAPTSQTAAVQVFPGQNGTNTQDCPQPPTQGGIGYPGTGGDGGHCGLTSASGETGSAGLALISPAT